MATGREHSQPVVLIERITREIQSLEGLVRQLSGEVRENAVSIGAAAADIRNLRESVSVLSRIIKDGNGESLVTRMSLSEASIADLEKHLKDMSDAIDELERLISVTRAEQSAAKIEEKKIETERRGQRLHFWATIIATIAALGTSLLALFNK